MIKHVPRIHAVAQAGGLLAQGPQVAGYWLNFTYSVNPNFAHMTAASHSLAGGADVLPVARPRTRSSFYLWIAVAMTCTVFTGFWFTYFEPLLRGTYPQVPPIVHVHGWSFFAWYVLLTTQAALIRSGRVTMHRTLGLASTILATVMIAVGLIVSTVRIDLALAPNGDPFWAFMGLPIFSIWILFAVFYVAAICCRRRADDHKRLMLLASATALSAATFRIFVEFLGYTQGIAIAGTLASNLFILVAMISDYRIAGTVHRVYRRGFVAAIGLVGGMFVLVMTPGGDLVKQGVAQLGRWLSPLY